MGIVLTTEAVLELVAMVTGKGIAITICLGHYGDIFWLLWGYVLVAMRISYGKAPMPYGCVDML